MTQTADSNTDTSIDDLPRLDRIDALDRLTPTSTYGTALAGIRGALEGLRDYDVAALDNTERALLQRELRTVGNLAGALQYPLIAANEDQNAHNHFGSASPAALSTRTMRTTLGDARLRHRRAAQFLPTVTPTGHQQPPQHPRIAAAVFDGAADDTKLAIIEKFWAYLDPEDSVDRTKLDEAMNLLGDLTRTLLPTELQHAASAIADTLLPDGKHRDKDADLKAYLDIGKQQDNGLSRIRGLISATTRALLDAVFAKEAAPGANNPTDTAGGANDNGDNTTGADTAGSGNSNGDNTSGTDSTSDDDESDANSQQLPLIDLDDPNPSPGDPNPADATAGSDSDSDSDSGDANADPVSGSNGAATEPDSTGAGADSSAPPAPGRTGTPASVDVRSAGQRRHDALTKALHAVIASKVLGTHRGLPVGPVVSIPLATLEAQTGFVLTGTGTRMKTRDAIAMLAGTRPYLLVFDDHEHRPLYLGRATRIATLDQRLALAVTDRGCSFDGCANPAAYCEVHHRNGDWNDGAVTDITDLTFDCPKHHRMAGNGPDQYTSSTAGPDTDNPGRTTWHHNSADPDKSAGRINHAHHPEDHLPDGYLDL